MINRSAMLLKYKEPAVRWINEADPAETRNLSVKEANYDRNVFLISNEIAEGDGLDGWIENNWDVFFDIELEGWHEHEALWPKSRTFKMFKEWFDVEVHTMLHDTEDGPIFEQDDD